MYASIIHISWRDHEHIDLDYMLFRIILIKDEMHVDSSREIGEWIVWILRHFFKKAIFQSKIASLVEVEFLGTF